MNMKPAYTVFFKDNTQIRVKAAGPEEAFFQAAKKLRIPASTESEIYTLSQKVMGVYLSS